MAGFPGSSCFSMSRAQVLEYLRKDPAITHVLYCDVGHCKSDVVKKVTSRVVAHPPTLQLQQHDISLSWDAHGLDSTQLYTTRSIYNDRITRLHGLAVCRNVARECGVPIRAVVMKSLEVPE